MPSTAVYLVAPASMARWAAARMKAGVSKSGSPAPKIDDFAPGGAQRLGPLGHGDRRRFPELGDVGSRRKVGAGVIALRRAVRH